MALDMYTPQDLLAVMFDERQTISTAPWLSMFYPRMHQSTQEDIRFDEIEADRKIAPFMLPNLPGRPILDRQGETIKAFRPAYTKPKDSIRPTQAMSMTPGEISRRLPLLTPQARWNNEVVRITSKHRQAIERLWQWMGARALIDGQVTIAYESGQSVTIDFDRASGHTITLGSGARWGDSGVNVVDNIQTWVDTVANATFGGAVTDVLMGSLAYAQFRASADVKDLLDTQYRGAEDVYVPRGIVRTDPMNPFTWVGRMNGIDFWRVAGAGNQFENNDGSYTDILGSKEVLLVAPGFEGIQAFGAIMDTDANLQPSPIFSKMWKQEDPSATFLMSQSAPLMIPLRPNCSLKATVLA